MIGIATKVFFGFTKKVTKKPVSCADNDFVCKSGPEESIYAMGWKIFPLLVGSGLPCKWSTLKISTKAQDINYWKSPELAEQNASLVSL
ncbi:hypothetical protein QQP08_007191 [Theobroma cacao]|nr:hypothetical protein QQP08_007191 [Theobroma cacao]